MDDCLVGKSTGIFCQLLRRTSSTTSKKVKAIIPVDLFGLPARHRRINELAKKYDLYVKDDAAQSFGASKIIKNWHFF